VPARGAFRAYARGGIGRQEAADLRVVDPPVHVHEADRIDHLVAGEAARGDVRVERHDAGGAHRQPPGLAALAPGVETHAVDDSTCDPGALTLYTVSLSIIVPHHCGQHSLRIAEKYARLFNCVLSNNPVVWILIHLSIG
jgi:hypothetical protein